MSRDNINFTVQQNEIKMKQKFNQKKLAADILAKRVKDNLTFRQLDKATELRGVSYSQIQRIETGQVMPAADTLAMVCNWLSKPVSNYF